MIKMKNPNFFIVGAPKCGTTALSDYLRTHPNIFMSLPKEPHFFAEEVREHFYPATTEEDYLQLFQEANQQQNIIGEASVMYLFFEEAIKKVYQFNPQAKLVVMLRNPIDLAYSWHSQAVFNTDEHIVDFEKAWKVQDERLINKKLLKNARMPITLQYKAMASVGSQVAHLLKIFPRKQVHFIFMEDFKNDLRKEYLRVLAFLEVNDDGRIDFPVTNQNKSLHVGYFAKLKRNSFGRNIRKIKAFLGIEKVALSKKINQWNVVEANRVPLSNEFRNQLVEVFRPEVETLEKLLIKDLSHWKK